MVADFDVLAPGVLVFRRAGLADLDSVAGLQGALRLELGTPRQAGAARRALDNYPALYAANLAAHFLAVADRRVVAIAGAFIPSDPPCGLPAQHRHGLLGDAYTRPDWRGQGLGRRLSFEAIEWLRGQGVAEVRLTADGNSRRLYESFGFKASSAGMVLRIAR